MRMEGKGVIRKAMVIAQPWVSMIMNYEKSIELHTYRCNYRGTVGIAASGTQKILGTAIILDCIWIPISLVWHPYFFTRHKLTRDIRQTLVQKIYHNKGVWGWVLGHIQPYSTPQDYTHTHGAVVWVKL